MALLLIPYLDKHIVRYAHAVLAVLQGYATNTSSCPMLFNPISIGKKKLKNETEFKNDTQCWVGMSVPAQSQWCTLLVYAERCFIFDTKGVVCYFPSLAIKDETLFNGTIIAGDLSSRIREDKKLSWTFTVVHALVSRGMLLIGSLPTRSETAKNIVLGMVDIEGVRCAWSFKMATFQKITTKEIEGINEDDTKLNTTTSFANRILHIEASPIYSRCWCIDFKNREP
jgi:hypothetical protein